MASLAKRWHQRLPKAKRRERRRRQTRKTRPSVGWTEQTVLRVAPCLFGL